MTTNASPPAFLAAHGKSSQWVNLLPVGALFLLWPLFLLPSPWVLTGGVGLVLWGSMGWMQWRRLDRGLRRPLLGVLAACLLGLGVSVVPFLSLPKALNLLYGLFLAAAVAQTGCLTRERHRLVGLLFLATLGVAGLGLVGTDWTVQKFAGWFARAQARLPHLVGGVVDSFGRVHAGFHPNEVGGILALLLPIALGVAIFPGVWWLRLGGGVVFLLGLPTFVLTLSRAAWLGLAAAVLFLLVLRWRWLWLGFGAALLAIGGTALALGPQRLFEILLAVEILAWQTSMAGRRIEIMGRGLLLLRDFPLTGVGLNLFPILSDHLYPSPTLGPRVHIPHAHNFFLQTALDLGVPGALAFFCLVVRTLVRLRSAWLMVPEDRGLAAGLAAGLLGFGLYGAVDAVTLGAKPGFLFWWLLGLAWAFPASPSRVQARPRRWPVAVVGLAVGGATLALLPQNIGALLLVHALVREQPVLADLGITAVRWGPLGSVIGPDRDLYTARALSVRASADSGAYYLRYLNRHPHDHGVAYEGGMVALRAGDQGRAVWLLLKAQTAPGYRLLARNALLDLRTNGRMLWAR
jgi:putative inorganic carbon (HCO3(-)) transporter